MTGSAPTALPDRPVDEVDLLVADAMLLASLGPDSDALRLVRSPGRVEVEITPLGRATLLETAASANLVMLADWVAVLSPTLVEHAVDTLGEQWRNEAEIVCDLLAAERSEQIPALVKLATAGPITVLAGGPGVGELVEQRVADPRILTLTSLT